MIDVNGMSTTVGPSLSSGTAASTWIKGSVVWEGSRPFVEINTLHDVFTKSGFAVFWEFKGGKFYLDLRK